MRSSNERPSATASVTLIWRSRLLAPSIPRGDHQLDQLAFSSGDRNADLFVLRLLRQFGDCVYLTLLGFRDDYYVTFHFNYR